MSTGIQFIMYYLIIYSSLITSYTSQVVSSIGSYVPPLPRYSMSTSIDIPWGKGRGVVGISVPVTIHNKYIAR